MDKYQVCIRHHKLAGRGRCNYVIWMTLLIIVCIIETQILFVRCLVGLTLPDNDEDLLEEFNHAMYKTQQVQLIL